MVAVSLYADLCGKSWYLLVLLTLGTHKVEFNPLMKQDDTKLPHFAFKSQIEFSFLRYANILKR